MLSDNSNNDLKLSGKNLNNLMSAVLEKKAGFRFKATGHSMSPFIKNHDIVTISPLPINRPVAGDIVAASFGEKKPIMVHRVIAKKQEKFIIKGDNNNSKDGLFEHDQIIGLVSKIERNGVTVWFGQGYLGRVIAILSKTGLLNSIALPLLRSIRRFLPF
ncbi:MAG: hypothetical protein GY707_03175 [Desulfobacteraceae bacterium]|nr:hypothetical protein [Desulfobacteraceae bacterium]